MRRFHNLEWKNPHPGTPLLESPIVIIKAKVYNAIHQRYQERPVLQVDGKYYVIRNVIGNSLMEESLNLLLTNRDVYLVEPVLKVKYLRKVL